MAQGLQHRRLILELTNLVPGAVGVGSELWSARHTDHRALIRESIKSTLNLSALEGAPPRPEAWSVSISHCPSYGGWLAVPRPARIGFDVEASARIQPRIVERACTKSEIAACPDPAFLWSAKEAYFKALESEQPATISNLTIAGWSRLGPDLYSFATDRENATGWIAVEGPVIFGAALIVSN